MDAINTMAIFLAPKCGFFFPPKIHTAISNGVCKAHLAYAPNIVEEIQRNEQIW